jgi:Uma2 family endonuclease
LLGLYFFLKKQVLIKFPDPSLASKSSKKFWEESMADIARKKATYQDLNNIPENMTGEIIDSELYVSPRPSRGQAHTASSLGGEIIPPYTFGRGGPGGWIILVEPEIRLGEDILAPDLAGWKSERFPIEEEHNWISAVPDWVREILSPNRLRADRIIKMPAYAKHGIPYFWLVDPMNKTWTS